MNLRKESWLISLFIARLGGWEVLEGLMHRQYWLETLWQTTSTEVWWSSLSNPNWIFWTLLECPPSCSPKKTQFLNTGVVFLPDPGKNQNYRDQMGMWGSGKENWALLPVLSKQLLQCTLLLWDIYLLPRSITKALSGNILISGHLQHCQSQTRWPKINYYIGYYLQMSETLLRKLILTLWNLKINRKQQKLPGY